MIMYKLLSDPETVTLFTLAMKLNDEGDREEKEELVTDNG